ncbi:MAG: hypothetical protein NC311_14785 [Muribaculaceae bacterium]|nr:hypothetical protein [Muribaculaceae bacterium]
MSKKTENRTEHKENALLAQLPSDMPWSCEDRIEHLPDGSIFYECGWYEEKFDCSSPETCAASGTVIKYAGMPVAWAMYDGDGAANAFGHEPGFASLPVITAEKLHAALEAMLGLRCLCRRQPEN